MKKTISQTLVIALGLTSAQTVWAEDDVRDQFNPVQTAVVSQSIASDARAAGLGDIGVATEPDVYSQAWNPAKYPFTISRAGFAVNYTPWLRYLTDGIALINAQGYYRLGDYQALSASVRYFTLGDVTVSGSDYTVNPYEFGIAIAYSRMLSERFSASEIRRLIVIFPDNQSVSRRRFCFIIVISHSVIAYQRIRHNNTLSGV